MVMRNFCECENLEVCTLFMHLQPRSIVCLNTYRMAMHRRLLLCTHTGGRKEKHTWQASQALLRREGSSSASTRLTRRQLTRCHCATGISAFTSSPALGVSIRPRTVSSISPLHCRRKLLSSWRTNAECSEHILALIQVEHVE